MSADEPTYRHTGERRRGVVDCGIDRERYRELVERTPDDYPGKPLMEANLKEMEDEQ